MSAALLTIDTELSPGAHSKGLPAEQNFATAILGQVADGEWGIRYQLGLLGRHGLKAVFFVEALSASVVGDDLLKRTIEPILSANCEVQLHLHTEWLPWFRQDPVPGRRGSNMADFTLEQQIRLLQIGIDNLVRAGAPRPIAFRAGNYGANDDTLRALNAVGLRYDASYNLSYLGKPCAIDVPSALAEPVELHGIVEVPVTHFADFPGHLRPAQLCAISAAEMRAVLRRAVATHSTLVSIVSHSFELLNVKRTRSNTFVSRRFIALCEMLHGAKDQIPTKGFADLFDVELLQRTKQTLPLRSPPWATLQRVAEQALGAVIYR